MSCFVSAYVSVPHASHTHICTHIHHPPPPPKQRALNTRNSSSPVTRASPSSLCFMSHQWWSPSPCSVSYVGLWGSCTYWGLYVVVFRFGYLTSQSHTQRCLPPIHLSTHPHTHVFTTQQSQNAPPGGRRRRGGGAAGAWWPPSLAPRARTYGTCSRSRPA